LANARHIKAVPGRKTDVKDCEWLADLLAHGLIRASFIPPPPIRDLRDLTRHRKSLACDRVKATNRVHKLLETANIKLANVVSDVLGVSGRAMLDALAAGETDPEHLAKLARGSLIPKVKPLAEALCGRSTSHHAFLLGQMLTQLDQLAALIARCDVRVLEVAKPFEPEIQRLQTIVGVGRRSAEVLVAEIGVDMSQFSTAGHLLRGLAFVPATTKAQGSAAASERARGITGSEPCFWSAPGPRPTPASVTWAHNSDASVSVVDRNEPGSPWPTASSSSPTTCSTMAWTSTISEPTTLIA
jgi:transposase